MNGSPAPKRWVWTSRDLYLTCGLHLCTVPSAVVLSRFALLRPFAFSCIHFYVTPSRRRQRLYAGDRRKVLPRGGQRPHLPVEQRHGRRGGRVFRQRCSRHVLVSRLQKTVVELAKLELRDRMLKTRMLKAKRGRKMPLVAVWDT